MFWNKEKPVTHVVIQPITTVNEKRRLASEAAYEGYDVYYYSKNDGIHEEVLYVRNHELESVMHDIENDFGFGISLLSDLISKKITEDEAIAAVTARIQQREINNEKH